MSVSAARLLDRARRSPDVQALWLFALTRVLLLVVARLAALFPDLNYAADEARGVWSVHRLIDVWFRWDSGHYARLVEYGYDLPDQMQASAAFFPLYPTLVRYVLGWLAPQHVGLSFQPQTAAGDLFILSGVILSNLLFLAALALIFRLVLLQRDRWFGGDEARAWHVGYLTVLLLCIAPVSFVFSSFLTESLFLLTTVAAFYAAERRWWWAAGVGVALATLTRPLGILLVLPLALIWWGQYIRGEARARDLFPLALGPLALLLFAGVLAQSTGDPLAFVNQGAAVWEHSLSWPWTAFFSQTGGRDYLRWLDQLMTLLFVGLSLLAFRLGPAYGVWALLATVGALMLKGNPVSMIRYVMVVFPAFIVLAQLGDRYPRLRDATIITFAILLSVLMALSAENFWVA